MLIREPCIRFRSYQDSRKDNSDVFAYVLVMLNKVLSKICNALFSTFGLSTVRDDLFSFLIERQEAFDFENLRNDVDTSIASFSTEHQNAFNGIFAAISQGVNAITAMTSSLQHQQHLVFQKSSIISLLPAFLSSVHFLLPFLPILLPHLLPVVFY